MHCSGGDADFTRATAFSVPEGAFFTLVDDGRTGLRVGTVDSTTLVFGAVGATIS